MIADLINSLIIAKDIENLVVVLYTDCVDLKKEELANLFEKKFVSGKVGFYVPKNVYYELQFMSKNSKIAKFKENALLILNNCRKFDWNLEDFYEAYSDKAPYIPHTCLFVFSNSSLKQKEFITNTFANADHYVWCDEDNQCRLINNAKTSRYAMLPTCKITFCKGTDNYKSTLFEYADKNSIEINKECINRKDSIGYGREASIRECNNPHFRNKCIKEYGSNRIPTGNALSKLKYLRQFGSLFPDMDIAFPEAIMYAYGEKNNARGFSMKKATGRWLSSFTDCAYDLKDAYRQKRRLYDGCVKKIFAVLLDLHCNQIYVSDLSTNNIMFDDKTGDICFVDSDSFQIKNVPGGGCAAEYKHRDIEDATMEKVPRFPLHEDFALAVLLYKIYVFYKLYFGEDGGYIVNWKEDIFQFDYPGDYPEIELGRTAEKIWKSLDKQPKTLFADEFHFRRSFSIGSWIEALGFDR